MVGPAESPRPTWNAASASLCRRCLMEKAASRGSPSALLLAADWEKGTARSASTELGLGGGQGGVKGADAVGRVEDRVTLGLASARGHGVWGPRPAAGADVHSGSAFMLRMRLLAHGRQRFQLDGVPHLGGALSMGRASARKVCQKSPRAMRQ